MKKVGFLAFLGTNYGTVLQSFALYQSIKKLGYECQIIGCNEFRNRKTPDENLKETNPKEYDKLLMQKNFEFFINKWFSFNEPLGNIPANAVLSDNQKEELKNFDAFVCGSDQIWKPGSFWFCAKRYLQFAPEEKRIGYAPSVGWNRIPEKFQHNIPQWGQWLSSVRYLSTRETTGSELVEKVTGRPVTTVLDPTFLLCPDDWNNFLTESKYSNEVSVILKSKKKYLLAYLLDTYEKYHSAIIELAQKFNLEIIWLTGRDNVGPVQQNCAETDPAGFVHLIKNASLVCADGFHGTCFSLNFSKPFIVLSKGDAKGNDSRMQNLMNRLGVDGRIVSSSEELIAFNDPFNIDYDKIRQNIDLERKASLSYLTDALLGASESRGNLYKLTENFFKFENRKDTSRVEDQKKANVLYSNPDFVKIKILAALLRDYGIKHVVISPGGRDVPIVRMFENNEGIFTLHQVVDERSAGYYALGIAAQSGKPVACICTSGTAASNYLPAVTEAYYTGIPIIFVTADRKQVYLNHGEDQTIPQTHIYDGVIKKSVTLPEGADFRDFYQARRDISDAILETTHNVPGPTHINIAIDDIRIGANIPREYWDLNKIQPKRIEPHILRVSAQNGIKAMLRWVEALSKSKKILLVYGQNQPRTKEQNKFIESFVSKFNCVVLTDHISNLSCSYSLQAYNMLKEINQKEFDDNLSPDILITVGGKRLMNDPLTARIRKGKKNIRHWSVTPDGKIKDFYFRLTSVLEVSQDYFFEFFSTNAGNIENDKSYYNTWKKYNDQYPSPLFEKLHANYIQSKFLPNIPDNSILHLGVGQSFYDSRKYYIKPSVHVFCNMGTNGIDGCTSTFMGQSAVTRDKLCFLLVGDLSFFYDMNSIWKKRLTPNMRILLVNNNGTDLLRNNKLRNITSAHNTIAEQWVKSVGFRYLSAKTKEEFDRNLAVFLNRVSDSPLFFEVLYNF